MTAEENVTSFEFYYYFVNGLIGTVLNCTVLFVALKYVDTRDKPRQIIVMNMTLADLITCTVYMITRPFLNKFYSQLCYPYYITIFTSQIASCVHLLVINLDKLLFIVYPLHYYQLVTRKRVLVVMFSIWFSLLSLGILAYKNLEVKNPCHKVQINPYIYLSIIVLYVLIITSSFVISTIIYYIARKSQRGETVESKKTFKRLFFVFSSTMWTFCTCLPYRVCFLVSAIFIPCHRSNDSAEPIFCSLTAFFFFLVVVGIVLNPLITVVTQRMYRQRVLGLFPFLSNLKFSSKTPRLESRVVRFRRSSGTEAEQAKLNSADS